METQLFDVLVVGGGFAGLSAALTLYRQLHTVLIFDNDKPRNAWQKPTHIVVGWEGRQAQELRASCRAELAATELVTVVDHEAMSVQRTSEGFEISDENGGKWRGRKLLIAAGKRNVFPDIPGYAENYPHRIFHCMFTFGYENRGSEHAGLLAEGALSNPMHVGMVVGDTKKFAKRITVYTNGDSQLSQKLAGESWGVDIDNRRIKHIQSSGTGLQLQMEDGHGDVDFLVHQPSTKTDLPLIKQLGLQLDERGDIVNSPPFFSTNVPGVFAAGDCATPFKIIPMAMFMGANAGAGVARALGTDAMEQNETNRVSGPIEIAGH